MDDFGFLHNRYDGGMTPSHLKPRVRILVVEDDLILGRSVKKFLEKVMGLEILYYKSGRECIAAAEELELDIPFCLISDISLEQGMDGLYLIDILREKGFNFVAIAMTGFASVENAISATKKGVFHYLTKPFELENLHDLVLQALRKNLKIDLNQSRETPQAKSNIQFSRFSIELPQEEDIFCGIIGRSPLMKEVFKRIEKVAATDSTVLITGASGTGKELVANALHTLSTRHKQKKVSVNCGAIPSELLESELFGHVKGSFTGAISNRIGRFEVAHGGSIFLDEIGDMPLLLQVKLLRVLQNRQIEPVGANRPIDVDVRIIAATHRDLEKSVQEGTFREDLFYRLNVIPIRIPQLRERREDISLLIGHFVNRFVSADGSNRITISEEALELLISYDWPGNVRELENVIERLVILRGGSEIRPEDLPAKIYRNNPLASSLYKNIFELPEDGLDLKRVLSDIEDSLIEQALKKTRGNKNQAAKLLTLNRTTLIEKMKKKSLELQV